MEWETKTEGSKLVLFKDGKKHSIIGLLLPEYKQLTLTPKQKMKNGKPYHWMEKMDAWGCNYDALKIAEGLGITLVVFQDKTENMWYRAELAKWLASKRFTHFKGWDLQVYLNDYDFMKSKILDSK